MTFQRTPFIVLIGGGIIAALVLFAMMRMRPDAGESADHADHGSVSPTRRDRPVVLGEAACVNLSKGESTFGTICTLPVTLNDDPDEVDRRIRAFFKSIPSGPDDVSVALKPDRELRCRVLVRAIDEAAAHGRKVCFILCRQRGSDALAYQLLPTSLTGHVNGSEETVLWVKTRPGPSGIEYVLETAPVPLPGKIYASLNIMHAADEDLYLDGDECSYDWNPLWLRPDNAKPPASQGGKALTSLGDLAAALKKMMVAGDAHPQVIIAIDGSLPVQHFLDVYDAVIKTGGERLVFVRTDNENGE